MGFALNVGGNVNMIKKLEYIDLKRSIESVKQAIDEHSSSLQINEIVLKALEKEIKNYQPPLRLNKDNKITQDRGEGS